MLRHGWVTPGSVFNAAFTMHVAVLDLFFAGLADGGNFDIEVEILARQWMITIHSDGIVVDLGDGNHKGAALSLSLELHAWLYAFDTLKGITRHFLNQLGLNFAIALFW